MLNRCFLSECVHQFLILFKYCCKSSVACSFLLTELSISIMRSMQFMIEWNQDRPALAMLKIVAVLWFKQYQSISHFLSNANISDAHRPNCNWPFLIDYKICIAFNVTMASDDFVSITISINSRADCESIWCIHKERHKNNIWMLLEWLRVEFYLSCHNYNSVLGAISACVCWLRITRENSTANSLKDKMKINNSRKEKL